MILLLLMCLFSFAGLVVSLVALGIVIRNAQATTGDNEVTSSPSELVVITGCDSGIGLELAKYIHASTDYSILCGFLRTNPSLGGHKELKKLSSDDSRLILANLDVTSNTDVAALKTKLDELKSENKIKRVAALINNAGVMVYGEFDWLTWAQVQSQINVNLVGTLRLTRMLVPYIIEGKGRIINISSVNDATVFPGLSVYSATKSALSAFSRGLGYELRKFGASVITLRLGDFARLTNIMQSHASHRDDMWNAMDANKRNLYGGFFEEFHEHLLANYGMTSPRQYDESNLFVDLRRALMSKKPPTTITCTPLGFRLFYSIVELLPLWVQYHLLDLLFQFGFKWKPSSQEKFSAAAAATVASEAPAGLAQAPPAQQHQPPRATSFPPASSKNQQHNSNGNNAKKEAAWKK